MSQGPSEPIFTATQAQVSDALTMVRYENTLESSSTSSEACTQDHQNSNAGESSSLQSQRPITTLGVHNSFAEHHPQTKSADQQPRKPTRRTSQHKKKSTDSSRHEARPHRSSRYGRFLAVPKLFGGRRIPRLPRCIWSLLSKPLTPPSIPVVSVTSPEGVTKYPFDHNYYGDTDSEDTEDSDSDELEDTDTSGMEMEEEEGASCCS
ncbi:hypothetical protein F5Y02DRAFT_417094 [Annulohypoxylon stygium]|nr:hypothetical protein F5Y02DRAFT_417094 [Annulohypoxylon stygium]